MLNVRCENDQPNALPAGKQSNVLKYNLFDGEDKKKHNKVSIFYVVPTYSLTSRGSFGETHDKQIINNNYYYF